MSRLPGFVALTLAAAAAAPAQAGVVIDATRVIYPADRKEVSVNLRNTGEAPSLIQAWTDAGDPQATPGDVLNTRAKTPFALTPPLFRLDPAKGQTLRLIYTQAPLPNDRETVFWLNVLDIPPRAPTASNAPNRLEMAFRHRLKIVFRPPGLPGKASEAARTVTWAIVGHDGQAKLEARNPSPYYVTFNTAEVSAGGLTATATPDMVPPFSTLRFALSHPEFRAVGPVAIKYGYVDDFGAVVGGSASASLAAD